MKKTIYPSPGLTKQLHHRFAVGAVALNPLNPLFPVSTDRRTGFWLLQRYERILKCPKINGNGDGGEGAPKSGCKPTYANVVITCCSVTAKYLQDLVPATRADMTDEQSRPANTPTSKWRADQEPMPKWRADPEQ